MPTPSGYVVLGHTNHATPKRYWTITALHAGLWYQLDRTRVEDGVLTPYTALYRETDFPSDMLANLLNGGQLRRVSTEWCALHGYGERDVVPLVAMGEAPAPRP